MHLTTLLAIAAAFCLSSVSAGPSPCLTPGACKTAAKNTPANIKFIQFPESYNSEVGMPQVAGFEAYLGSSAHQFYWSLPRLHLLVTLSQLYMVT